METRLMPHLVIEIDELAPGPNGRNGLQRMHWATKKKIRDRWTWKVREQAGPPQNIDRCEIEIERHYARHPMDRDNLTASSKIVLDALTGAGVIADDDSETVTALEVTQRKVDTVKEQKTIIRIDA